jgi:hypothetical protein
LGQTVNKNLNKFEQNPNIRRQTSNFNLLQARKSAINAAAVASFQVTWTALKASLLGAIWYGQFN